MEIIPLLDRSTIIDTYEVIDFREWENGIYYRIFPRIINNTESHIREYIDEKERNYSYHWQENNGTLIIRWDNAPYHNQIKTYPHHKYLKQKIFESKQVAPGDILNQIENKIS